LADHSTKYCWSYKGVADIVMNNDRMRYVSIHQTPAFPYLGEQRKLEGKFQNVYTIPMPAETSFTCGYRDLFLKALEFVSETAVWEPDLVIVCAGYDALDSDELASVSLQADDYRTMTDMLHHHLVATCTTRRTKAGDDLSLSIPTIFGLEGGYQLSPMAGGGNLQDAVLKTIEAIQNKEQQEI
jgi:acetoin utilization deacetylase AcuC-like enzyme